MKVLSEEEALIVGEALQRELALLESKVNLTKEEIKEFERKYAMSSEEFLKRFEGGELGDEQDFFEWWGLLEGLGKIEEKIAKIKAVLS